MGKEVEIPVMFGSGRTLSIGYQQIKATHFPNLVITEIGPIKEGAINFANSLRKKVDEQKIQLINDVVIEAAEALAFYGNYWPKPEEQRPNLDELVERYIHSPVVLLEADGIKRVLINYIDGFKGDGGLEQEQKLKLALDRITDITQKVTGKLAEQGKTPQSLANEEFEKWLENHPSVKDALLNKED